MDGSVVGVAFVELQSAEIFQRVVQLRVEILPLAHPRVGKELLPAKLPARVLGAELVPLVVDGVPDVEQREEVRLWVVELLVRGGSGLLLIERAFSRVLDAQSGRDDEQFARGALALRLEQHPANRRVDG